MNERKSLWGLNSEARDILFRVGQYKITEYGLETLKDCLLYSKTKKNDTLYILDTRNPQSPPT